VARPTKVRIQDDENGPDAVDVHVGARIRLRRTLLGLSQEKLGVAVGLTFQQIQKYERGANRVSASRLWQFSQILDVPVSFFFDDLPPELAARAGVAPQSTATAPVSNDEAILFKRETLELLRAYYRITDPALRRRLYDMTKAIGASQSEPDAA